MAGGLMQLVAYGAQDVYLTGQPKVTFFQAVYKRHTNFAMENIEQVVNGSTANSGHLSVTIARNGDLVSDMYLELTTMEALDKFTDDGDNFDGIFCAERAISDIELTIGGQRIDKHNQKWWRLYAELYLDESKKLSYGKMSSSIVSGGKVYLPLLFFFNRNPGLALPLIALQYHEVRLDINLTSVYTSYFTGAPKVWSNYIYLDTEERRRFASKGHEYLIEQVQHTGTDTVVAGTTQQIRLSYNHPVKELVWCYTDGATTDDNSLWNFCQPNDACTLRIGGGLDGEGESECPSNAGGAPRMVINNDVGVVTMKECIEENTGDTGTPAGPLSSFKLVLNGQDRFKEQGGKYFNQVQSSMCHSGCPMAGVYSYSFALKPEDHQPTGSCNFSRIDNAQVSCTLKAAPTNNEDPVSTQHMFAVNYNVLRIQSGMGGLAFSN